MKLRLSFALTLVASALSCLPTSAGITVIDFGALEQDGNSFTQYVGTVETGDPATVALLQNNAGTPQINNPVVNVGLTDGATLSWTNVSAWNNMEGGLHPGETFFLNRASDPLDTFFTVTTANPNDLVTIDFFGAIFRDALIVIDGNSTVVAPTSNNFAWTNVATDLVGSVTGELLENSFDEGNIGAARITITPATIPEPSGTALLGLGVCAAAIRRRRS